VTFESTNKLLANMKEKVVKEVGKFYPHHSPCSNYFYLNKPKTVKKCKKGVNMIYHVYTIICKQNEKMYIG
jgi:ribosomal protein S16